MMKNLHFKAFKLFIFCFLISLRISAQTPKAVEADITASFKKIGYWNSYRFSHSSSTDTAVNAYDSVGKANKTFREKLAYYTSKFPFTLNLRFKDLDDSFLTVLTSKDGLFRIYSWDNSLGGTMRYYENVFQYKVGSGVSAVLGADTSEGRGDYHYDYSKLYTLKSHKQTYYLAIYHGKFSTKDLAEGIQVFSIENGKLTDKANLIKTAEGPANKLYYYYNRFLAPPGIKDKDIRYNEATKTISLPVVAAHGKLTNAHIVYKFNGRYFERVKN